MCFTLGGGGSRGDVTQNSYINRRPWQEGGPRNPNSAVLPGMYETAGAQKMNTETDQVGTPTTPKRSSLTTGGSA
tara:strand:+ start:245 stop:469 length:225 start_codon:yes stop_codon:yes gene_type:complete